MFAWQSEASLLVTFTDSDWAGCKRTYKSTSAGVVQWGTHALKAWSATQSVLALSSAEAELYAMVKGASQCLGMMSMAAALGIQVGGRIESDASAALGIVQRHGLGKLRHINVQYLWLQSKVRDKVLAVKKVLGTENPADLMTKYLDAATMEGHMARMGFWYADGRAESAPTVARIAPLASTPQPYRGRGTGDAAPLTKAVEPKPLRSAPTPEVNRRATVKLKPIRCAPTPEVPQRVQQ